MELFRAGLYFLQSFLKKMYFLMLKSVLSCSLAQFTSMTKEKKRIKYTTFMKKVVDKPRRNQYCIKERMQNITGKEAPL